MSAAVAALLATASAAVAQVSIDVDPAAGRAPISPYIYGTNQDLPGVAAPARRYGGNRSTGYNWENNASNAGSDYNHQSDDYLTWVVGIPDAQATTPGIALTHFIDQSVAAQTPYTLVTLPMAGYVAADKSGQVSTAQAAPSSRWVQVVNNKPTALSTTPDLTDGKVYVDEEINFLLQRYGAAGTANGVRGYNLDNEPDLWNATHARLHPVQTTCAELLTRSVDLAKTIKRMDPGAETLGFVSYGFSGYLSFQDATDWTTERTKGTYNWFVDYYLDQMKKASDTAGRRLLDVLDLHNYTEAKGGGVRVNATTDYTNIECNKARLQAPRTLWDPTYIEDSWIGQWNQAFLPLLPKIQASIDAFYPGTKFAMGEYAFGGGEHITGGIAQADVLGIFGRSGVYMAYFWEQNGGNTYIASGFKLYLDYDGAGGKFGDTKVSAATSDVATCTTYASIAGDDASRLHVIVLNKAYATATPVRLRIAGSTPYVRARVFAFDSASAALTERTPVASITGNDFTYTLPALTAAHFVLESVPLEAWRQQYFGTTAGTGVAADTADPDLDGRSNLLEYALGSVPTAADAGSPAAAGLVTDDAGTHLTLTFDRTADPALVYTVEASDDLTSWSPILTSTGAQNVAGSVVATDSEVLANHPHRFLRLRVSN